jgi:hypothetical protein
MPMPGAWINFCEANAGLSGCAGVQQDVSGCSLAAITYIISRHIT